MAPTRARVARLLAVMLVLALVGPAFAECVEGSASAAGRHACCAGRLEAADAASTMDCCVLSAPSNDGVPAEGLVAQQPLRAERSLVADGLVVPSPIRVLAAWSTSRRATHVPLYLQQVAFLI